MNKMKISITVISAFILLLVNTMAVSAGQNDSDSVIEELITEALQSNPQLKAFNESINSLKERPAQVQSLDNPRLKMSIMNLPTDTFEFDQEPMTQKHISIMQKLPFPGKLRLKGTIAEKAIDMAAEDYIEQKNMLIMQVKTVFVRILFLDLAIDITEENRKLLREFVKIAETKYEVGSGIQQDVIKAQVELSKMTDRLIPIQQQREIMTSQLNTLLNRPVETPFITDKQIKLTDLKLSFEDLKKIAEENQSMLKKKKHLIESRETALKLSEKNYYPDFDIGVSYGQRDDSPMQERADFLSASVMINIPLWYKVKEDRKVAEDAANVRKAQAEYSALKNNIVLKIKTVLAEIDSHVKRVELLKSGLIPQSRLSLDSALSAYRVNKVNFLTLVNSQLTLYNFVLDYHRAIAEHEVKLAELESVIGQRISGSPKVE
jgi:cobalt-zinc-cadmium efflux system outer membrane protein